MAILRQLSSVLGGRALGFPQKGVDIFSQSDFHFRFRVFKAGRLNSDGWLLAAAVPSVICEPELAFDTQKRRYPERYGMISHRPSHAVLTSRNNKPGLPRFVGLHSPEKC